MFKLYIRLVDGGCMALEDKDFEAIENYLRNSQPPVSVHDLVFRFNSFRSRCNHCCNENVMSCEDFAD